MSNYTNENLITTTVPNNARAIKIGDKIFTGFYDVSGGGTEFYRCASVTQPSTQTFYTVSGAGITDINGDYEPTEDTSYGQPVYSLTVGNTTYYLFLSGYNQWGITSSDITDENFEFYGDTYYTSDDSTITSEWYSSGLGNSSTPPTVTAQTRQIPGSWTGYKAVLNNGVYSFESTVTSGLSYSSVTPVLGNVYSNDALQSWIPTNGLVFYASLNGITPNVAETGQELITVGNVTYQNINGILCCSSDDTKGIGVNELQDDLDPGVPKTVSVWVYITDWPSNNSYPYIFVSLQGSGGTAFQIYSDHSIRADRWSPSTAASGNYVTCTTENCSLNTWYQITCVDDGLTWKMYVNGIQKDSKNVGEYRKSTDNPKAGITCADTSGSDFGPYNLIGYVSSYRIYNRSLSVDEITTLSKEFTPTNS